MNEVIERIKEKIKNCKTSIQEDRARKGAYVDCIVMIKESGNLGETRNAVLGEVRADVKELLQMIAEIPCTCDKIYTDRKLRAPDCPRCNWVEDDIVKKASRHFA